MRVVIDLMLIGFGLRNRVERNLFLITIVGYIKFRLTNERIQLIPVYEVLIDKL